MVLHGAFHGVGRQRDPRFDWRPAIECIRTTQRDSGEIPWHPGGKTDPWDHVESAMGLTVGGRFEAAHRAFGWLREKQLSDGSWYAAYRDGEAEDRTRDANFTSYVAVGVYHHYRVTGDIAFLRWMWPTVRAAVDFALSLQADGGEIHWAVSPRGKVDPMALLTGSSSIYMSLKCALAVAAVLDRPMPGWIVSLHRLGEAISRKPYLFNMTKSRFAMDWFYPVLCGAVTGLEAQARIDAAWRKFVVEGLGVRCVSDRPWVTIAETAELVLALEAMGKRSLAQIVFSWIADRVFHDGSYWCGFTYPEMVVWPEEKLAWTNAAVLLAADALYRLTPAAGLFGHHAWANASCLK